MNILTEEQHRALAFIEACNSHGYGPEPDEVARWLAEPRKPLSDMYAAMASFSMLGGVLHRGAVTDQLVRLGWVYRADARTRLFISELGEALLRDADAKSAEVTASATVVLGSDNPLSYAALMSELAAAGSGLLIDPYIRREELMHIVQDTTLTRLLVSEKVKEHNVAAMRSFLGYVPADRGLDVRIVSEGHDRYMKAEDGQVFIIGSSMNMVALQKATTVFVPVPEGSCEMFDKLVEDQWSAGEPLRPEAPEPEPEPTAGNG